MCDVARPTSCSIQAGRGMRRAWLMIMFSRYSSTHMLSVHTQQLCSTKIRRQDSYGHLCILHACGCRRWTPGCTTHMTAQIFRFTVRSIQTSVLTSRFQHSGKYVFACTCCRTNDQNQHVDRNSQTPCELVHLSVCSRPRMSNSVVAACKQGSGAVLAGVPHAAGALSLR